MTAPSSGSCPVSLAGGLFAPSSVLPALPFVSLQGWGEKRPERTGSDGDLFSLESLVDPSISPWAASSGDIFGLGEWEVFYFILVCDPTSQASPKHPTPEVVDTASWPLEVDFAQPLTWSPVSRASLLSQEAFTWQSPSPSGFPFPIVPSIGGVHHTMTPPPPAVSHPLHSGHQQAVSCSLPQGFWSPAPASLRLHCKTFYLSHCSVTHREM